MNQITTTTYSPSTTNLPGNSRAADLFERNYIACRTSENRMYTDAAVRTLPMVDEHHPHFKEWVIRGKSCRKLVSYLSLKKKPITIAEIGCGNGWLSHQLACIPGSTVTGIDINKTELQQATRVFGGQHNLSFMYGDLAAGDISNKMFDIIVFAASIQYFKSLEHTLFAALERLNKGGEIHIVDSPFYCDELLNVAKERTVAHYTSIGFPAMAANYFHHCMSDFEIFNHKVLYNPTALRNKLFGKRPFPWIAVIKG
jgi:protein-L-isoaspartate O-methyltransferase